MRPKSLCAVVMGAWMTMVGCASNYYLRTNNTDYEKIIMLNPKEIYCEDKKHVKWYGPLKEILNASTQMSGSQYIYWIFKEEKLVGVYIEGWALGERGISTFEMTNDMKLFDDDPENGVSKLPSGYTTKRTKASD